MRKIWIFAIGTLLMSSGCATKPNPIQAAISECMASHGSGRDSSGYWLCNERKLVPHIEATDPANAAFWQLYYRAQTGIWLQHEDGKISYDASKTASLQLQDDASQEIVRRQSAMSDLAVKQSQAFMQRMQGFAAFSEALKNSPLRQ